MSRQQVNDLGVMFFGAITGTGIGTFLFQALGTFVLGLMSAAGAYFFTHVVIPKYKEYQNKKKQKKAG